MANRSRDAANRRDSRTTAPVSTSGSGGSADNPNIMDPVQFDELSETTSPTVADQGRMIVPLDITEVNLQPHTGKLVDWQGGTNVAVVQPTRLGARVYSDQQMHHLTWHMMPGPGVWDKPIATSKLSSWFAFVPDWLADTFWSRFQESVISVATDPAAATTTNFSRYIVGSGATGVWSSHVGKIAMATPDTAGSGAVEWTFIPPREGMFVWNEATNKFLYYDGSNWLNLGENLTNDLALADLSDVDDALSPSAGEVLGFDGTHWTNVSAGGAHGLDSHSDTNLAPGPAKDGYVVSWDDTAGEFVLVAGSGTAGPHTIISAEHTDTTLTGSLAANHKLRYNGSAWTNVLDNLDSISDVVITGPIASQVLAYNGTNWVNQAVPTPSLDSLSNVNTSGKLVGDVIRWDGSNWVDRTLVLDDLGDVVISGPTSGQGLVYNGSAWVNGTISATVTARACCYRGTSFTTVGSHALAEFSTATLSNATLRPTIYRFQADIAGKWAFNVSLIFRTDLPSTMGGSGYTADVRKGANAIPGAGTLLDTQTITTGTYAGLGGAPAHYADISMVFNLVVHMNAGEHLEVFPTSYTFLRSTLASFYYLGA